ncbi:MAG: T9SS type A sorting domain-containing protein, partial [Bacteroidota bacterium]
DTYFGVHVVGGSSPTYTGTYYYNDNDAWQATPVKIESDLRLFTRNDNAATSWSDASATVDAAANTLTATALNTEFMLGLTTGVLPIELLDFQARLQGEVVVLAWATASETNNDFFVVEKSQDRQHWTPAVYRDGAGNSTRELHYLADDRDPYPGISYYRLKQVDYDGQFSYSPIREVNRRTAQAVVLFPNPTEGLVTLSLQAPPVFPVRVLNAMGQDLSAATLLNAVNANRWQLDLRGLPKGIYFVQLDAQSYRIVKQ